MTRTLPADVARCPGSGSDAEGWREGCQTCQRRTSPPADPERVWMIEPLPIIACCCAYEIPPDHPGAAEIGRVTP